MDSSTTEDFDMDERRESDSIMFEDMFIELCNVWLDTKGPILMKRFMTDQKRKELLEEKEKSYKKKVIDLTRK